MLKYAESIIKHATRDSGGHLHACLPGCWVDVALCATQERLKGNLQAPPLHEQQHDHAPNTALIAGKPEPCALLLANAL